MEIHCDFSKYKKLSKMVDEDLYGKHKNKHKKKHKHKGKKKNEYTNS